MRAYQLIAVGWGCTKNVFAVQRWVLYRDGVSLSSSCRPLEKNGKFSYCFQGSFHQSRFRRRDCVLNVHQSNPIGNLLMISFTIFRLSYCYVRKNNREEFSVGNNFAILELNMEKVMLYFLSAQK